jgi:cell division protein FtsI (penicillin-binding protein 3)
VIGTAGIEKAQDEYLRDPAKGGAPLQLSLDLTIQAATAEVLDAGMRLMNAKGATAILMDAHTGEVISLVSLPDFDPNTAPIRRSRAIPPTARCSTARCRGSTSLAPPSRSSPPRRRSTRAWSRPMTMLDTKGPMTWGRYRIRDFRNYGPELSVTDVIVKSSNIGTARMAIQIGAERQQDFLRTLGFLEPTPVELVEAPGARPLLPRNWSELSTMTISYGHGLSASPLHLAAGYASIVNGGTLVKPTLLRQTGPQQGERVISPQTSAIMREMLRKTVTAGTAGLPTCRAIRWVQRPAPPTSRTRAAATTRTR